MATLNLAGACPARYLSIQISAPSGPGDGYGSKCCCCFDRRVLVPFLNRYGKFLGILLWLPLLLLLRLLLWFPLLLLFFVVIEAVQYE
jgi:hypothetical protein